jgi:hypothetical protein
MSRNIFRLRNFQLAWLTSHISTKFRWQEQLWFSPHYHSLVLAHTSRHILPTVTPGRRVFFLFHSLTDVLTCLAEYVHN